MKEENRPVEGESKLSLIIARSRKPRAERKSQIPYGILTFLGIAAFAYYLSLANPRLALFWIFGVGFGFVLQRSRFCFTAASRDPWITGSTSVTRAVLVAFALTSVGYLAIKYGSYVADPVTNLAMLNVNPIGLPLVIGGLMFGTGMVISGGCASGTLMRIGEGFTMQILSLVFFVIGSFWGAHDMAFWSTFNKGMPVIFLPNVFGWIGALFVQGLIILLLYIAAVKWQKKRMGSAK